MSIAEGIVKRPTTFIILFSLLIGLSLYFVFRIPVELFPATEYPVLTISTKYANATPEEIEETITRPLEGVLSNVGGLIKITSESFSGRSDIILELTWGADLAEATNEVRERLDRIRDSLPKNAGKPVIFKRNFSSIPILFLSVSGKKDIETLFQLAKKSILPRLEQVNGVSSVNLYGGRKRVIRIETSQNRLEAYGLTISKIASAVSSQNIQLGSGRILEGTQKYLLETRALFRNLDDIRNTIVTHVGKSGSPTPIYVNDLAEVTQGFEGEEPTGTINGKPGIIMNVQKKSGTNAVQVVDRVLKQIEVINSSLPPGIEVSAIYSTARSIRNSLKELGKSALLGGILAVCILLIFLRNIKSTIIIAISIPTSLLITGLVMYFAGITMNMMTLAGLSLGIGMMVDSSIVILENIFRYRQKGSGLQSAAILGSREMVTAISASVFTTVCVFLPLIIFKSELGYSGVMFKDMIITIVISLLTSLFVAICLVPVLCSSYLKLHTKAQNPIRFRPFALLDSLIEHLLTGLENLYRKILKVMLDNKIMTSSIIALIFVCSLFALEPFFGGNTGLIYRPKKNEDILHVNAHLPQGTRMEITKEIMSELSRIAMEDIQGYSHSLAFTYRPEYGELTFILPPPAEQTENPQGIIDQLAKHYDKFPMVHFSNNISSGRGWGGGSNASIIDITLRSENLDASIALAGEIKSLLENQLKEDVINPYISLAKSGKPVVRMLLDRNRVSSRGLNVKQVAQEVSNTLNGRNAGQYQIGNEKIDIKVILRNEDRNSVSDIGRIFLTNTRGDIIPINSIASMERTTGPIIINREDRSRIVRVTAALAPGVSLNRANSSVRKAIADNIVLDNDVILEYKGDLEKLNKNSRTFLIVIIMALALVYGVMASLFESLKDPFIIFISIFCVIPGILIMHSIMNLPIFSTKTPLSIYTAMGLLMLTGIAVNNGIVLVDYMNLLRKRNLRLREAIVDAGSSRLRPIIMTSMTTILGMVPLAFSTKEGAELVRPIGQTIIGGMIMSSILTLFLIPIMYEVMNRRQEKKQLASLAALRSLPDNTEESS